MCKWSLRKSRQKGSDALTLIESQCGQGKKRWLMREREEDEIKSREIK